MARTSKKDSLLEMLEKEIEATLKEPSLESKDRIAAIREGVKLAMVKHKIDGNDDEGGFFTQGRKTK